MDLPPSSYHDSLEELWDEEEEPEEIETVVKGVPSAYHQYWDVLSKVKAEKLPPHHTCDHHIELRGLYLQKRLDIFIKSKRISPHFNPSLPTIIETDASDYALGAVLSQVSDEGQHPISFESRKSFAEELNYEIHYKELLGIVWALKCWRDFLLSLSSPFEVLTNHSSLKYFMSPKILTFYQAFWAVFPSQFHLSITYHPGHLESLPDALSHWDNVY
ncbi:hypothetical protein O181_010317 [Austropuccinia psidii MF-1]|uniref:Reverse transcriptase RNase H-like domain-containing protein n=1 Tax=Austropuccinia psidii MF-1 TaxID=1389203 RepID=A0A9Q3BSD2_9BASI|nr:hypothetical protein [Austropuccinia psidii MF-1]